MSDTPKKGRGRPVNTSPEQVVKHRNRLRLNAEQLANKLGVSVVEAEAFTNGTSTMDDTVAARFAALKKETTRKNKPRGSSAETE